MNSSTFDIGPDSGMMNSTIIREVWIEKEMTKRSVEFTENKKLTLFVGTWNVNAKKPTEDLAEWLVLDGYAPADIYCIGLQEIVDLNAGNLLVDNSSASKPWADKIERTLQQKYVSVGSKHLVGLSLAVYVRRALMPEVGEVATESVGVGIMGVGGNKGAVGIRFTLYNTSFCFINAHLAAHQHNSAGRNSDYQNICARLAFILQSTGVSSSTSSSAAATSSTAAAGAGAIAIAANTNGGTKQKTGGKVTLFEHDHLFWVGDLNYRLSLLDLPDVHRRIESGDYLSLLTYDQLLHEKTKGNAFKYFKEGPINFAPTYKYQPGTSLYERREDKKKRVPAWCDRIQWIGENIRQECYGRTEGLLCSDHKPVYARFTLDAREVNAVSRANLHQSLVRQLDAWENEAIPRVAISPPSVDFPNPIVFEQLQERSVKIENTGSSTVVFHIRSGSSSSGATPSSNSASNSSSPSVLASKPWLSISPSSGSIPARCSLAITFSLVVSVPASHAIQSGLDILEDILIVALENGREYFVQVSAKRGYERSCFGSTIEYLVNILSLPKELWRMVDAIFERGGMQQPGLFSEIQNSADEIVAIRSALDCGTPLPSSSSSSSSSSCSALAACLFLFLRNLAEPLIGREILERLGSAPGSSGELVEHVHADCKQSLLLLPPSHYNTFVYLLSFFRECLRYSSLNLSTPAALASMFTDAILPRVASSIGDNGHSSMSGAEQLSNVRARARVGRMIMYYLTSEEFA